MPLVTGCNPAQMGAVVTAAAGLMTALSASNASSASTGITSTPASATNAPVFTPVTQGTQLTSNSATPPSTTSGTQVAANATSASVANILGLPGSTSSAVFPSKDTVSTAAAPKTAAEIQTRIQQAFDAWQSALKTYETARKNLATHTTKCTSSKSTTGDCAATALTAAEARLKELDTAAKTAQAEYDRVKDLKPVS